VKFYLNLAFLPILNGYPFDGFMWMIN